MRITVKAPTTCPWLKTRAYQQQLASKNVGVRSFYSTEYAAYEREVMRTAELARERGLDVRTVLLCAPGESPEEVRLILDAFPGVKKVRLIDWHRPNIDLLDISLRQGELAQRDLEVFLHHDDLRNIQTVPRNGADFAFANKLFDLHDRTDTLRILMGISRCLNGNGMFFSYDYPFGDGGSFYELAALAGLTKIAERHLMRLLEISQKPAR